MNKNKSQTHFVLKEKKKTGEHLHIFPYPALQSKKILLALNTYFRVHSRQDLGAMPPCLPFW